MIPDASAGVPVGFLAIAALLLALLGAAAVVAGIVALFRARPLRFGLRTLLGAILILLGAVFGAIASGVHGYRALTQEELAATIVVQPTQTQRFQAIFEYPDGRRASYELSGDEIYVDAHILKWKPIGNLLGLRTLWTLDRVAGRHRSIEQERSGPRTVYELHPDRVVDLFDLRRRYRSLAPLYDAEYGSASFVPANEPARFELRVGPSGLLIRRVG